MHLLRFVLLASVISGSLAAQSSSSLTPDAARAKSTASNTPVAYSFAAMAGPDHSFTGQLRSFDPDFSPRSYRKLSGPDTVEVTSDGRFTFKAGQERLNGVVTFTFRVENGKNPTGAATGLLVAQDELMSPKSGPLPAGDRWYELTPEGLAIYATDTKAPQGLGLIKTITSLKGTCFCLSRNGRVAFVAGKGIVTAVNLREEKIMQAGKPVSVPAYDDETRLETNRWEMFFDTGEAGDREAVAMATNPANGGLLVVVRAADKARPQDDWGSLIALDPSPEAQPAASDAGSVVFSAIELKDLVHAAPAKAALATAQAAKAAIAKKHLPVEPPVYPPFAVVASGINRLSFSPDGHFAFLFTSGGLADQAPSSPGETPGGWVVLDLRSWTKPEKPPAGDPNALQIVSDWAAYLDFIPNRPKPGEFAVRPVAAVWPTREVHSRRFFTVDLPPLSDPERERLRLRIPPEASADGPHLFSLRRKPGEVLQPGQSYTLDEFVDNPIFDDITLSLDLNTPDARDRQLALELLRAEGGSAGGERRLFKYVDWIPTDAAQREMMIMSKGALPNINQITYVKAKTFGFRGHVTYRATAWEYERDYNPTRRATMPSLDPETGIVIASDYPGTLMMVAVATTPEGTEVISQARGIAFRASNARTR